MKAFIRDFFILAALAIAAGLAFMWSGAYDVSARVPHWGVTLWVLNEGLDRSVDAHSQGIQVPDLKDPALLRQAIEPFDHACRLCHGAPGHPRLPFVKGMYPNPPDLGSDDVQANSDAHLYWIVDNGIKMTAMPAFGATPAKNDVWALVALVRRLPELSAQDYDSLLQQAGVQ